MPHRESQVTPGPRHIFGKEKKRQEGKTEPRHYQHCNSYFPTPLWRVRQRNILRYALLAPLKELLRTNGLNTYASRVAGGQSPQPELQSAFTRGFPEDRSDGVSGAASLGGRRRGAHTLSEQSSAHPVGPILEPPETSQDEPRTFPPDRTRDAKVVSPHRRIHLSPSFPLLSLLSLSFPTARAPTQCARGARALSSLRNFCR